MLNTIGQVRRYHSRKPHLPEVLTSVRCAVLEHPRRFPLPEITTPSPRQGRQHQHRVPDARSRPRDEHDLLLQVPEPEARPRGGRRAAEGSAHRRDRDRV